MKPNYADVTALFKHLSSLHGSKLEELCSRGIQFADYLKTLMKTSDGFALRHAATPLPHVGRVIVDGVLQVGHRFDGQVSASVDHIVKISQAQTVSGFKDLLGSSGVHAATGNYKSKKIEHDLMRAADFFAARGIDSFKELRDWLECESHRDELLTLKHDPHGAVFSVSDKTADYFRVIVGHWDALAVDSNTWCLLDQAAVNKGLNGKNYTAKEMRTIAQVAAIRCLHCRPIDLDASIYDDSLQNPARYAKSKSAKNKGGFMASDLVLEVSLPDHHFHALTNVAKQSFGVSANKLARQWLIERLLQISQPPTSSAAAVPSGGPSAPPAPGDIGVETLEEFAARFSIAVGCFYHKTKSGAYSLKKYQSSRKGRMGVFGWVGEVKKRQCFQVSTYDHLADSQARSDADRKIPKAHYNNWDGLLYTVANGSVSQDYCKAVRALRVVCQNKK